MGIQLALVKIQGLGAPVHPGVLGGEVELARLGVMPRRQNSSSTVTSSKPWDCSWVSSRSSPWAVEGTVSWTRMMSPSLVWEET